MQYTNARQAKYGYKGTIDDDGYTSFMHSHMVKNSEWGAVAYLTHSKYGRNGNEIEVNTKSPFVTGGDEGLAYIDNVLQSTTGNVYGIYDMSGGGWERTATFDKKGDETQLDYGKDMVNTTKVNDNYVSTKYVTIYENGTSTYVGHDIFKIGKIGDATKEISSRNDGNEGYYCRWFGDQSFFFNQNSPYVARGGYNAGSTGSGIFCCNNCTGVSRRL